MSVPYPELRQAETVLKEVLGNYSSQVEAEWNRVQDECGSSVYTLKLKDLTDDGEAEDRFAPEDLKSLSHMRYSLYTLWDELLRIRSQRLLKQLHEAGEVED